MYAAVSRSVHPREEEDVGVSKGVEVGVAVDEQKRRTARRDFIVVLSVFFGVACVCLEGGVLWIESWVLGGIGNVMLSEVRKGR